MAGLDSRKSPGLPLLVIDLHASSLVSTRSLHLRLSHHPLIGGHPSLASFLHGTGTDIFPSS